jgi:dihydroorotase-like cyclic amidohydrolase
LKFAFAIEILDLISHVHLASFVIVLPKQLKNSTFPSRALNTLFVKEYITMMIMMTMMTTKTTATTTTRTIYDGNVCYMNST